jgi:glycosyltransferase involved in cell wall biosynthesis
MELLTILLIGPLPPPLGGVRVSFERLCEDLGNRSDLNAGVINVSGVRFDRKTGEPVAPGIGSLFSFVNLVRRIFGLGRQADVVTVHHSTEHLHRVGGVALLAGKLFGKPVVLRGFGATDLEKIGRAQLDRLLKTFSRASLVLIETQRGVAQVKKLGVRNVEWLANSRPMPHEDHVPTYARRSCRKFVYVGHVRRTKGLPEIIEAGERFADHEEVAVDVYGSLRHDLSEKDFAGLKKVRFCGGVPIEDLPKVLSEYDVLLLPSYHEGEGYPGIVFDAYAVGMPVICTNWQALPEIVDETSGRLIEPHSADALYHAMKELMDNDDTFAVLRAGVLEKRNQFDSNVWNERFVEMCRSLA